MLRATHPNHFFWGLRHNIGGDTTRMKIEEVSEDDDDHDDQMATSNADPFPDISVEHTPGGVEKAKDHANALFGNDNEPRHTLFPKTPLELL